MAGSFGYEAEHYEISMQIGGLKLFPAVKAGLKEGAQITAHGVSCRAQIGARYVGGSQDAGPSARALVANADARGVV